MPLNDRSNDPPNSLLDDTDTVADLRVLIIDDDEEDALLTKQALSDIPWFSCTVDGANSYASALTALRATEYDVILLDHGLGAQSGLDLIEEAFGSTLPVAVVLLTGMASHEVDEAASRAGIAHLLEKSELRSRQLERSVRYALERTRIERELRSTRALFRTAFDALDSHVAILDDAGVVVEVNNAWTQFAVENGFPQPNAGRGDNYLNVCDASAGLGLPEAGAVAQGLRALLSGEIGTFSLLYPCNSPDEERWFQLSATPMADGSTKRLMVAHQNVTARLRADRDLKEREERYRLVGRATKDVLWDWDIRSNEVVWGEMALTTFGHTAAESCQRAWWTSHVHPDDLARIDDGLARLLRGDGETWSDDYRYRRSDGTYCDVLDRAYVQRDERGNALRMIGSMTDLTEQRNAQSQLRDSEARYRLLFNSNPSPLWVTDRQTMRFISANDAALAQYGYTREEFLSLTRYDIRVPEEWDQLDKYVADPRGGVRRLGAARHRKKSGEVIDVELVLHSIEIGDQPCQMVLATDVTERNRAERASAAALASLEFEKGRLSDIFSQAPAFMAVLRGPNLVFEMVNEEYVRVAGRNPVGRPVAEALPEAVEQGMIALVSKVLATGEPYVGAHVPYTSRTEAGVEHRYILNFVYQPLAETDGSYSGVLVHGVDVTGQVDSEEALRQSEVQYRTLVELLPDGILIHVDGVIVFANSSAARILRSPSVGDIVGRRLIELVDSEDIERVAERLSALRMGEDVPRAAIRWNALDGAVLDMDVSSMGFMFEGRQAVYSVFRDTTEHRLLEEQLRQALKMEAVGQLAGGVAHDFNNLLTVIKVNVEFMLEDMDDDSPNVAETIEVRDAADRAAELTRQLLAFSRKQILQPRALDCNVVVENVQPMLSRLIREDIVMRMHLAKPLGWVMADPGQLEQVLLNLAVNARDAMPKGGELLVETAEVTLDVDWKSEDNSDVVPGRYVVITVKDTGTGISALDRQHIFEPFFTTKPVGQGTGLGLATVYGIVKQSGGYLRVDSTPDEGTTIGVYLPAIRQTQTADAIAPVARNTTGSETILVVEDMDALRIIARRVLTRSGYTVLEARNGMEALRLAHSHADAIDLVLTDVIMPEMNGVQLVHALKDQRPGLKVLFMSGYADDEGARSDVVAASGTFVAKPFSPAGLLRVIRETLDS